MSSEIFDVLLGENPDPVAAGFQLRDLMHSEAVDADGLLAEITVRSPSLATSDPAILGGLLRVLHTRILSAAESNGGAPVMGETEWLAIETLLDAIPETTPNRYLLLHLLAMIRSDASLRSLVQRLDVSPPRDWIEAAQILSPLMQRSGWPVSAVFPQGLSLLAHPSLASALLDIANFVTRQQWVAAHPATDRATMLANLLGEVTNRLTRFEEDPRSLGDDVNEVQQRLAEAVSLAISLCDSLSLIGNNRWIGKLYQAMELKHRRVQCEAAGALARLGESPGRDRLLELVSEPAVRLRAIHYADELGFGDRIDEAMRSDEATAEAEMALWMSQPQQMGVSPTHVEVVDQRRMLWPSFDGPVDVFLVRFEYRFGDQIYSNVGITGPAVFTLSCDVADLPADDIYAIYAGWHAEHPDIFAIIANQLNAAQKRIVEPLRTFLDRAGYEDLSIELLGFFLDEQAAVFQTTRNSISCRVVTDGLETIEQPIGGRLRPLAAIDLFNLYKGRKMLRTFNS